MTESPASSAWVVGDRLDRVTVGRVAHGGHWVARVDGRVLFVRHALASEVVDVVVTALAKRHAFADAVAVVEPSPHRVLAPCAIAAVCGGCDFQHVAVAHQRDLKAQVVAEQLSRLAGITWTGVVEALDPDDLGWRTRMRYHRSGAGWGLRAKASHDVVPLPEAGCLIADPALRVPEPVERVPEPAERVPEHVEGPTLVGATTAEGPVGVEPRDDLVVTEHAAGRDWQVRADGFWQVHPQAADTLVDAVLAGLEPRAGERALDLYCGVGLFSGALVDAGVTVTGVEGGMAAVGLARRNVPGARFHAGSVDRVLGRLRGGVDLVVLDPPRVGAGRRVVEDVCARRPRTIAYVACDPAALARDLATASGAGYVVESIRAFDLFPMTHHVECVAILRPR